MKKIAIISFITMAVMASASGFTYKKITDERKAAGVIRLWSDYQECSEKISRPGESKIVECSTELKAAFTAGNENAIALVAIASIEDNLLQYSKRYKVTMPIDDALAAAETSASKGIRLLGCTGALAAYHLKMANYLSFHHPDEPEKRDGAIYAAAKWAFITVSLTEDKYQDNIFPRSARRFLERGTSLHKMTRQDISAVNRGVSDGAYWVREYLPEAIGKNKDGSMYIIAGGYDVYLTE